MSPLLQFFVVNETFLSQRQSECTYFFKPLCFFNCIMEVAGVIEVLVVSQSYRL